MKSAGSKKAIRSPPKWFRKVSTIEKITHKIRKLPSDKQEKVLEYIEVLEENQNELNSWNSFSLENAMKGLEDDQLPEYTEEDLKEKWK